MTVVAAAGGTAWADALADALRARQAVPARYTERANFVSRLVDDGVALILVDGADAEWRFWTTTPKASPATRRIPVVVVTDDGQQQAEALRAGANLTLRRAEVNEALPDLLENLASVPDAATLDELQRQCAEALPPEAVEAVRRFNAGEFYKQHDLFEALWMHEPGAVRNLYQGVLQVGIAYYQITRGNWRGAQKMLLRSAQWLAMLPDSCRGIDVAQLRLDAAQVRAELERVGEAGLERFDHALLKPVRIPETRNE